MKSMINRFGICIMIVLMMSIIVPQFAYAKDNDKPAADVSKDSINQRY